MDDIDRRILMCVQADATVTVADIADRVGLSQTPCWRRIQNLEKAGIIRQRVALLDRDKLNLGVTVFVGVRTREHNQEWLDEFARAVVNLPEVVEFYRMSGEIDYLMKIVVPDIASYDAVYKRLIAAVDLFDVSSSFAMEELKCTSELPVNYLP